MKDLGLLKGPLLIFGGVYSNFQALKEMMRITLQLDIDPQNVICTGDMLGNFAQPEECLQMLIKRGVSCIAGQAETGLRRYNASHSGNHNPFQEMPSEKWYDYANEKISQNSENWLAQLPQHLTFNYYGKKYVVMHGSFHNISDNIFKSTPWSVKASVFKDTQADVILAGHCGLPFAHLRCGKMWLNPGVIGRPANDGTTRVWYLYLNFNEEWNETEFEHRSFEYDFEETMRLTEMNDLPSAFTKSLKTGLWESTANLPEYEATLMGKGVPL